MFNRDTTGLPQNEESVSSCTADGRLLVSGSNDYRGLLDKQENFTGWYFSRDGGRHLTNEGLLPAVRDTDGTQVPSGGDPVYAFGGGRYCSVYAASLNYGVTAATRDKSGVAIYRSSPQQLATCPQGSDAGTLTHPSCWPKRRFIDTAAKGHFLDKEWLDVGRSGSAGEVVWIAYGDLGDFNAEGNEESGVVKAVRCIADLASCTKPIVLSGGQEVAEYPDVTIGPDGRTYITWGEFFGDSFIGPSQRAWIAVAEPGSTTFHRYPIYQENQVMRGQEVMHANSFRTGTMFKNTVAMVRGRPQVMAIWERCRNHTAGVCEEPAIRVAKSTDRGRTWSAPHAISAGGDNYFPGIDTDPRTGVIVAAWYTHRFDPVFHNRQDVEMVRLTAAGRVLSRARVTRVSNETEADPTLQARFIGDYLEVSANAGIAYLTYNANRRHVRYLGHGVPVPQQDNYLRRVPE